ncbi:hypothetical protein SCUP234_10337 [Seiridium cupressi]
MSGQERKAIPWFKHQDDVDRVTLEKQRQDADQTVKDFCDDHLLHEEEWRNIKHLTLAEAEERRSRRDQALNAVKHEPGVPNPATDAALHGTDTRLTSSTAPDSRRLRPAQPTRLSTRVMKLGQACEVVVDQSRRLVLRLKRHPQKVFFNATLMEPPTRDSEEKVFGSFLNMYAFENFFKDLKLTHGKHLGATAIITFHAEDSGDAVPGGDTTSMPLLPFQPTSTWTSARHAPPKPKVPEALKHLVPEEEERAPQTTEEVLAQTECANCHKFGHGLGDCVWPINLRHGDIYGRPVCNTKTHCWDNCPNTKFFGDDTKVAFLCTKRAGKAMIRADWDFYPTLRDLVVTGKMTVTEDSAFPWSRENCLQIMTKPDAVKTLEEWSYETFGGVCADPFNGPMVILGENPYNSSFTVWRANSREFLRVSALAAATKGEDNTNAEIRVKPDLERDLEKRRKNGI